MVSATVPGCTWYQPLYTATALQLPLEKMVPSKHTVFADFIGAVGAGCLVPAGALGSAAMVPL